ncbi:hypothetical protein BDM02DRAFT_1451650 [Thelephora ganbajun]|uniref:Uncharacterized protein n=1 Tax=Thelephora ganbajun TaxID=370292 RepID=A0ACB6ZMC7_THEGA|nr:hypothetical protein BDM02DRAFT_1451650 [Thelephora ganbajun]
MSIWHKIKCVSSLSDCYPRNSRVPRCNGRLRSSGDERGGSLHPARTTIAATKRWHDARTKDIRKFQKARVVFYEELRERLSCASSTVISLIRLSLVPTWGRCWFYGPRWCKTHVRPLIVGKSAALMSISGGNRRMSVHISYGTCWGVPGTSLL